MIDLNERQHLISMACSPNVYGAELPAKIKEQWKCPYCGFSGKIENLSDHLASECNMPYNTTE
jgi:hypothetical protein